MRLYNGFGPSVQQVDMTAHISWDYYTLIKVPHIVLDCYMPITDIYAAIRYSKTQDEIQLNQFSDLITDG